MRGREVERNRRAVRPRREGAVERHPGSAPRILDADQGCVDPRRIDVLVELERERAGGQVDQRRRAGGGERRRARVGHGLRPGVGPRRRVARQVDERAGLRCDDQVRIGGLCKALPRCRRLPLRRRKQRRCRKCRPLGRREPDDDERRAGGGPLAAGRGGCACKRCEYRRVRSPRRQRQQAYARRCRIDVLVKAHRERAVVEVEPRRRAVRGRRRRVRRHVDGAARDGGDPVVRQVPDGIPANSEQEDVPARRRRRGQHDGGGALRKRERYGRRIGRARNGLGPRASQGHGISSARCCRRQIHHGQVDLPRVDRLCKPHQERAVVEVQARAAHGRQGRRVGIARNGHPHAPRRIVSVARQVVERVRLGIQQYWRGRPVGLGYGIQVRLQEPEHDDRPGAAGARRRAAKSHGSAERVPHGDLRGVGRLRVDMLVERKRERAGGQVEQRRRAGGQGRPRQVVDDAHRLGKLVRRVARQVEERAGLRGNAKLSGGAQRDCGLLGGRQCYCHHGRACIPGIGERGARERDQDGLRRAGGLGAGLRRRLQRQQAQARGRRVDVLVERERERAGAEVQPCRPAVAARRGPVRRHVDGAASHGADPVVRQVLDGPLFDAEQDIPVRRGQVGQGRPGALLERERYGHRIGRARNSLGPRAAERNGCAAGRASARRRQRHRRQVHSGRIDGLCEPRAERPVVKVQARPALARQGRRGRVACDVDGHIGVGVVPVARQVEERVGPYVEAGRRCRRIGRVDRIQVRIRKVERDDRAVPRARNGAGKRRGRPALRALDVDHGRGCF